MFRQKSDNLALLINHILKNICSLFSCCALVLSSLSALPVIRRILQWFSYGLVAVMFYCGSKQSCYSCICGQNATVIFKILNFQYEADVGKKLRTQKCYFL